MSSNQVARHARGGRMPATKQERQAAQQAAQRSKEVIDDVRYSGLQMDGAMALAGHAMQGLTELDNYRRALARDDVSRNLILSEIEETAIQQVKSIQRATYPSWGL